MVEGTLRGKRVLVLGFGRSGQAAARLLLTAGAEVVVSDGKPREDFPASLLASFEAQGARFVLGEPPEELFARVDLVVASPGVPPRVFAPAREQGVPVIGELELASRFLHGARRVFAVTGTNGKTTTTAMLTDILRFAGRRVFVGGNYGTPLSEFVLAGQKADDVVLEVSSFQLETVETFRPHYAVLLNVTPDHLEWHGSFAAYRRAKMRLFLRQEPGDVALLPEDLEGADPSSLRGRIYTFGVRPGSEARLEEGAFVLSLPGGQERFSLAGFRPLGRHNRLNFVAAAMLARLAGAEPEAVVRAMRSFVGFPHRLEFVGCFGGVYFVNDSKATNVDATRRALEGLAGPLVLIMGGRHKGGSYAPLADLVRQKVRLLILMGESRHLMAEELRDLTETLLLERLEDAVLEALARAEPGDTVLLSPAAASFDQFQSYQERGDHFRETVLIYAPQFLGEDRRTREVTYH